MQYWSLYKLVPVSQADNVREQEKPVCNLVILKTVKVYRSSATSGTTNTLAVKWMRPAPPALLRIALALVDALMLARAVVGFVVGVAVRIPVDLPTCEGFVETKKNVPPRGVPKPTLLAKD